MTIKKIALSLIMLLPLSAQAEYFFGYPIYPYVGVDYQFRETPMHDDLGDNIFDSQFQQGQLYIGVRFLEHLGIEFSYSKTNIKNRHVQLGLNDVALGYLLAPGVPQETHLSQAEYKTYTANVVGFYLLPFDPTCRTELVGSVGISRIQPKLIDELTHMNNLPLAIPSKFTFEKRRTVLRLMGGVQYKITPNMGIRGSFTFEDTSQFHDQKPVEAPNSNRKISLKGSFLFGLGIFFNTAPG